MKNGASTFRTLDELERNNDPQIASNAKIEVRHDMSQRAFCGIHIGETRA
jgi:hypothetical protein